MKRLVDKEVARIFEAQNRTAGASVITEADLETLPAPVREYMKFAKVVGKERIRTARLQQTGLFRGKPSQKFMPLTAKQFFTTDPPAFVWHGEVRPMSMVSISARDKLENGKGSMVLQLVPIDCLARATTGPEMDQGALVRYLGEAAWFPTAFLSDTVRWEPVDDNSAKAVITVGETSGSATFHFGNDGRILSITADRFRKVERRFLLEKWSGEFDDYAERCGFRVPLKAVASWHPGTVEFPYIQLEVTDILYNE